jgi:oxygen-independent coproporphyrinogen-3 oxidase
VTPISHLYLHIPFCHRVCPYCSFHKHTPGGTDLAGFLQAVLEETRLATALYGERLQLQTIYWGGGTPSLLSSTLLREFLPTWLGILGNPTLQEWTVEMNPRTLTSEKLQIFRQHGVSRASLGVQAWDQPTLTTLGRDHAPEEAQEACELIRAAKFPIFSLDLMFSVPGQTESQWLHSLECTLRENPQHISCYNLTYEEDTAFFESLQQGLFSREEEKDASHFGMALQQLPKQGFRHYETSNYARPGYESLHNQKYWQGADYLGLGPSAVSTIDRIRTKNVSDTDGYMQLLGKGWSPAGESETLTESQWRCERIALELRTAAGVSLHHLLGAEAEIERLQTEGLVESTPGLLRVTPRGKYLVDSIAQHLWESLPE